MNAPHRTFDPFTETTSPLSGIEMWNQTSHREWLEDRRDSHIASAMDCIRREKRERRYGNIGAANDDRRELERHFRMAAHYSAKIAEISE